MDKRDLSDLVEVARARLAVEVAMFDVYKVLGMTAAAALQRARVVFARVEMEEAEEIDG